MRFGTSLPFNAISPRDEFQSPEAVRVIVSALERTGIFAVSTSEHPIPASQWLHNDPAGHDALDPLTVLSFVAAQTSRLYVYTNVLVLPYRNPFLTAKQAATLQVLSGNRLILGVGVGYQEAEFEALGVPYRERGALTTEAMVTMREVWTGESVVRKGRYFNAIGNTARPAPLPTPPMWVGGGSDAAVERAGKLGDGWIPHFAMSTDDPEIKKSTVVSLEHFSEKVAKLREIRDRLGRTGTFDIGPRPPVTPTTLDAVDTEKFLDSVAKLRDRGATFIWTPLPRPSRAGYLESIEWYDREVIARFT